MVQLDIGWVPSCRSSSLYIRPTLIGTEGTIGLAPSNEALLFVIMLPALANYYTSSTGTKAINLLCDPQYVRAWPGGTGGTKMGANYAPTLSVQKVLTKICLKTD